MVSAKVKKAAKVYGRYTVKNFAAFPLPPIYYCNVLLSGKQTLHQYYGKRRGLSVIIADSETDIPERKYTGF